MEDKNLTIGDIAKELGVSKTTVSRAISGKGRIGSETKERVLQYIEEHHYRPNVIAKGLAQSRTYNIGLVIPGDYNVVELPFFQNCMIGISKIASSMDYDVLLSIVTNKDISMLQRIITNHKVDGIILTRTLEEDASIECLKETGIPFVTIGSFADLSVVQVDNDHRSACKELTEKLLEQGLQKMALIGGSQNYVVTGTRLKGFIDAFGKNDVRFVKEHIYLDVTEEKQVKQIVEQLLVDGCECIITMDDHLCGYVLNVLRLKNIEVPKDIKVASFYDSSILENNVPSITSIQFDVQELGETTCKRLFKMMEEETISPQPLLGYRVSLRDSTKMV